MRGTSKGCTCYVNFGPGIDGLYRLKPGCPVHDPKAPKHEHDWQPILTWSGRYRCAGCGVIGYRGVVIPPVHLDEKPEVIFPYKCKTVVKGQTCGRGAVSRKPQACAEHKR